MTEELSLSLAMALIFIDQQTESTTEDDQIKILESCAAALTKASLEERQSLANAFNRLGHPEMVDGLGFSVTSKE